MKYIITIMTVLTISACTSSKQSDESSVVEPHMVANSEARKLWCKRRNTHTQKDYFDCVKGYGGQHSQYSVGVVYPDKNAKGDK